jgi:copper(I)-binding protein
MALSSTVGPLAGLAMFALGLLPAAAQDFGAGNLVIHQPWTRATPGGAQVAGGYLTVVNKGSTLDRLVGGSLAAAEAFGLHEMTSDGGVMRMRPTGPLDIPPGGSLTLSPSGKHIMFTGLRRGLQEGEQVGGTLVFEHAGTVPVRFTVEGIGAKSPTGRDRSGPAGQAMPGMDMN